MKVALLGATRGMGRALARLMADRGDEVCLLGRTLVEVERSGGDLEARGTVAPVPCIECDLERLETFGPALTAAEKALQGLDAVVVSAGIFATQDALEDDSELAERLLRVDFSNTVLFCEAAREQLLQHGGGTLCVFSSVAGERGRKPVVLYGAAKAGLTHYLEGLDHRYRSAGLNVVTVKPGFVKTSMTSGLAPPPFAGEPEAVAERVLTAIDRGSPVVYAPAPWRYVMAVIRSLPRAIMRRVEF